jgi:hypothetical protein
MDQGLFSAPTDEKRLMSVPTTILSTSPSPSRIDSALNFYARLLSMPEYHTTALDKLTRHLLHRWPKIRNSAAELLYLETSNEMLAACDWNGPVAKNKPVVLALRKEMGVAGVGTASTVSQ